MKNAPTTEDPWSAINTLTTTTFDSQKYYNMESSYDRAFFLIDLSKIIDQYFLWKQELPFVTPYYAIKCNPNPVFISLLSELWSHFDCASAGEIKEVLTITKSPEKIIYANPIKGREHLQYAKEAQVDLMTFDSKEELEKVKNIYPEARLILRIAVDDSHSVCKFNSKFGCEKEQVKELLDTAKTLQMNIAGVSFHVGSGCQNADVYRTAILDAKETIIYGKSLWHDMNIIDLWGGYPGTERKISFSKIAQIIRTVYEENKDLQNLTWIAEPGRYMVTNSHTLVTEVIWVKQSPENIRYYLNEGLYMSLSGIMFDYQTPHFTYERQDKSDTNLYPSTFFWPTCDSLDKVGVYQSPKLALWDKVIFHEIGDYSIASATTFNGFQKAELIYTLSNPDHQKYIKNLKKRIEIIA